MDSHRPLGPESGAEILLTSRPPIGGRCTPSCARGEPHDRAEDYTQEFFVRLIADDWLKKANPALGRFRAFLLTILKRRILSDLSPKRLPRQQQFEHRIRELPGGGPESAGYDPPAGETPDEAFDRAWAQATITTAREYLRVECEAQGKSLWWAVLAARHPDDPTVPRARWSELAVKHGVTVDQAQHALKLAEKWLARLIREEVQGQVGGETAEDEIRELMSKLGR